MTLMPGLFRAILCLNPPMFLSGLSLLIVYCLSINRKEHSKKGWCSLHIYRKKVPQASDGNALY